MGLLGDHTNGSGYSLAGVSFRFRLRRRAGALLVALAALAAAPPARKSRTPAPGAGARAICSAPICGSARATDLYVERSAGGYGYGGGTLLRRPATSARRGRGPMELRGRRDERHWMHANQRDLPGRRRRRGLPNRGPAPLLRRRRLLGRRPTGRSTNPPSFEIWRLDQDRRPLARSSAPAPSSSTACATSSGRGRAPLAAPPRTTPAATRTRTSTGSRSGTSVGWSDIYPADYDRQWINVAGLRGCFAFVMRVDPQNLLYESNENDNRSVRIVRLPYHPGHTSC